MDINKSTVVSIKLIYKLILLYLAVLNVTLSIFTPNPRHIFQHSLSSLDERESQPLYTTIFPQQTEQGIYQSEISSINGIELETLFEQSGGISPPEMLTSYSQIQIAYHLLRTSELDFVPIIPLPNLYLQPSGIYLLRTIAQGETLKIRLRNNLDNSLNIQTWVVQTRIIFHLHPETHPPLFFASQLFSHSENSHQFSEVGVGDAFLLLNVPSYQYYGPISFEFQIVPLTWIGDDVSLLLPFTIAYSTYIFSAFCEAFEHTCLNAGICNSAKGRCDCQYGFDGMRCEIKLCEHKCANDGLLNQISSCSINSYFFSDIDSYNEMRQGRNLLPTDYDNSDYQLSQVVKCKCTSVGDYPLFFGSRCQFSSRCAYGGDPRLQNMQNLLTISNELITTTYNSNLKNTTKPFSISSTNSTFLSLSVSSLASSSISPSGRLEICNGNGFLGFSPGKGICDESKCLCSHPFTTLPGKLNQCTDCNAQCSSYGTPYCDGVSKTSNHCLCQLGFIGPSCHCKVHSSTLIFDVSGLINSNHYYVKHNPTVKNFRQITDDTTIRWLTHSLLPSIAREMEYDPSSVFLQEATWNSVTYVLRIVVGIKSQSCIKMQAATRSYPSAISLLDPSITLQVELSGIMNAWQGVINKIVSGTAVSLFFSLMSFLQPTLALYQILNTHNDKLNNTLMSQQIDDPTGIKSIQLQQQLLRQYRSQKLRLRYQQYQNYTFLSNSSLSTQQTEDFSPIPVLDAISLHTALGASTTSGSSLYDAQCSSLDSNSPDDDSTDPELIAMCAQYGMTDDSTQIFVVPRPTSSVTQIVDPELPTPAITQPKSKITPQFDYTLLWILIPVVIVCLVITVLACWIFFYFMSWCCYRQYSKKDNEDEYDDASKQDEEDKSETNTHCDSIPHARKSGTSTPKHKKNQIELQSIPTVLHLQPTPPPTTQPAKQPSKYSAPAPKPRCDIPSNPHYNAPPIQFDPNRVPKISPEVLLTIPLHLRHPFYRMLPGRVSSDELPKDFQDNFSEFSSTKLSAHTNSTRHHRERRRNFTRQKILAQDSNDFAIAEPPLGGAPLLGNVSFPNPSHTKNPSSSTPTATKTTSNSPRSPQCVIVAVDHPSNLHHVPSLDPHDHELNYIASRDGQSNKFTNSIPSPPLSLINLSHKSSYKHFPPDLLQQNKMHITNTSTLFSNDSPPQIYHSHSRYNNPKLHQSRSSSSHSSSSSSSSYRHHDQLSASFTCYDRKGGSNQPPFVPRSQSSSRSSQSSTSMHQSPQHLDMMHYTYTPTQPYLTSSSQTATTTTTTPSTTMTPTTSNIPGHRFPSGSSMPNQSVDSAYFEQVSYLRDLDKTHSSDQAMAGNSSYVESMYSPKAASTHQSLHSPDHIQPHSLKSPATAPTADNINSFEHNFYQQYKQQSGQLATSSELNNASQSSTPVKLSQQQSLNSNSQQPYPAHLTNYNIYSTDHKNDFAMNKSHTASSNMYSTISSSSDHNKTNFDVTTSPHSMTPPFHHTPLMNPDDISPFGHINDNSNMDPTASTAMKTPNFSPFAVSITPFATVRPNTSTEILISHNPLVSLPHDRNPLDRFGQLDNHLDASPSACSSTHSGSNPLHGLSSQQRSQQLQLAPSLGKKQSVDSISSTFSAHSSGSLPFLRARQLSQRSQVSHLQQTPQLPSHPSSSLQHPPTPPSPIILPIETMPRSSLFTFTNDKDDVSHQ